MIARTIAPAVLLLITVGLSSEAGEQGGAEGCADGTREGLLDAGVFPDIAACAGPWSGGIHGSSAASLCAPGWSVCGPPIDDYHERIVGNVSFDEATSFDGCYAFAAANNYDQCLPCATLRREASKVAGMGSGCEDGQFVEEGSSCLSTGRVDAYCCLDPMVFNCEQNRDNPHDGVVCCRDPTVGVSGASTPGTLRRLLRLREAERYEAAENVGRQLLAAAETEDSGSVQSLRALYLLIVVSLDRDQPAEAEALAHRLIRQVETLDAHQTTTPTLLGYEVHEQRFGGDPGDTASGGSLGFGSDGTRLRNSLVWAVLRMFPRDVATRLLETTLQARKERAPGSLRLGQLLYDIGWWEFLRDNYELAQEHFLHALSIHRVQAPGTLDLAQTLMHLASVRLVLGDYRAAEEEHLEALAIKEQLAPGSRTLAASLANLGILYYRRGMLEEAERYMLRAVEIHQEFVSSPVQLAPNFVYLGIVAVELWEFSRARDYFERATDLYETYFSTSSGGLAIVLSNLGELAFRQGDLDAAMDYGRRALPLFEQRWGPESVETARELSTMGAIARARGDLDRAQSYHQRALAIREAKAPGSPEMAASLRELGDLARSQGNLQLAVQYLSRAISDLEREGQGSTELARSLHARAELARDQGEYSQAEAYLRRAQNLWAEYAGNEHPEFGEVTARLAEVLAAQGKVRQAFDEAVRAERVGSDHLRHTARSIPERQALLYSAARVSALDLVLTLATEQDKRLPEVKRTAWDTVIRSRALVLDELGWRNRAIVATEDAEVVRLAKEFASIRARLARLVINGPSDESPGEYTNQLTLVRREKEEIERALSEKSLSFRSQQEAVGIGLPDVAASLGPKEALVSFVRYRRNTLTPLASYLAFVMRGGADEETALVPLGSAAEIEALVSRWGQEAARGLQAPGWSPEEAEVAYRKAGETLRRKVWDPIAPHLAGADLVLVVPDGSLHRVNLAALPTGETEYLVEQGPLIHYLSAERDLVPGNKSRATSKGMLAMGAPAFDERSLFASLAAEDKSQTGLLARLASLNPFRGQRSACGDFESLEFSPLPASSREVTEVVSLWKRSQKDAEHAVQLIGLQASEAAFKVEAPGKRVLHLATHGFFLEGRCPSALGGIGGAVLPPAVENPLLLSGLALAGANHRKSAGPDEEDGILTAEEVAALDLSGVEWAVLSACDTGVGEIKAGEGIFGLRRAFQVAGVRTLIVSLWRIEDETTRAWMKLLYRGHFVDGLPTAEAMRQASLRLLQQRRSKGEVTHPFYWGAFVAAGDWR